MEGRYSRGVLTALTRSSDPKREEEFNHWHDTIHIPDIMETLNGSLHDPIRWRNTAKTVSGQQPKFVATYETEEQELEPVFEKANEEYLQGEESRTTP